MYLHCEDNDVDPSNDRINASNHDAVEFANLMQT